MALNYHVEEMPEMADFGALYVVVAHYETWRDGEATMDRHLIPTIKRRLLKRFMQGYVEHLSSSSALHGKVTQKAS